MSDADFKDTVDVVSKVIDGAGVVVVVAGLCIAIGVYALAQRERGERSAAVAARRLAKRAIR